MPAQPTLKDVSHTAPYGTDARDVWSRGGEYEQDDTEAPERLEDLFVTGA
jgi:hypothetical protein